MGEEQQKPIVYVPSQPLSECDSACWSSMADRMDSRLQGSNWRSHSVRQLMAHPRQKDHLPNLLTHRNAKVKEFVWIISCGTSLPVAGFVAPGRGFLVILLYTRTETPVKGIPLHPRVQCMVSNKTGMTRPSLVCSHSAENAVHPIH